jgi:hypothetical protein
MIAPLYGMRMHITTTTTPNMKSHPLTLPTNSTPIDETNTIVKNATKDSSTTIIQSRDLIMVIMCQ